jgi:hypothetical protein
MSISLECPCLYEVLDALYSVRDKLYLAPIHLDKHLKTGTMSYDCGRRTIVYTQPYLLEHLSRYSPCATLVQRDAPLEKLDLELR